LGIYREITFIRGVPIYVSRLILEIKNPMNDETWEAAHVDYNPLKGMFVLISSTKLSIVPYAAGPESRGHSRTAFANISILSCFPSFIVHWILNFEDQPRHVNWYPTLNLNACVKPTDMFICEKILTASGYRNQIYFQTIH
jgi:hypothetical protein